MRHSLFILLSGLLIVANVHADARYSSPQALDRLATAHLLGWISAPNNRCEGYFANAAALQQSTNSKAPVTLSANGGTLSTNGISTLTGHLVITQPGRMITADKATITATNGELIKAQLSGNVLIHEGSKVAAADNALINLINNQYQMQQVNYRVTLTKPNMLAISNESALSAWGKASDIISPTTNMLYLKHVTYSTCPPQSRAWTLKAAQLTLNRNSGRGQAKQATLYLHEIPILYAPYFNFPIDNRRQSGLLYPQFSYGSESGWGIGLPFYWNIAPNYDDTVIPYFYTKRGLALNNFFRYLTPSGRGNIIVNFLPNDWAFRRFQLAEGEALPPTTPGVDELIHASATRDYLGFNHQTTFSKQWQASISYGRVSDDYYVQDLGGVPVMAQNQLLQQAKLIYNTKTWSFLANLQAFQTLHPLNQAVVLNQYQLLPQLLATSDRPIVFNYLNYQWLAEAVRFKVTPNPGQIIQPPVGERYHLIPELSLPYTNEIGTFTPRLQANFTQYNLSQQLNEFPNTITRFIPIFSLDNQLFLQRDWQWGAQRYQQTLEPRLFYLRAPYHDQHDIPIFDSALQPFDFAQLFTNNRFTGSDRIGDADQLSLSLTTRLIDPKTGEQKLVVGIGIIRYFATRKVTLCATAECIDSPYAAGSTSATQPFSPIATHVKYNFNTTWNGSLDGAWDPNNRQTQTVLINLQYKPQPNYVINVGYNYIRNGDFYTLPLNENSHYLSTINTSTSVAGHNINLSEPTLSFAWPLSEHWQAVGNWSYSLNQHHAAMYFAGIGYDSCCWGVQTVLARNFNGFNVAGQPEFTTGIYLQWTLKGLAVLAANDLASLLTANIPGYQASINAL